MSVTSKIKQLAKLKRKAYRDAFVEEHVKTSLPFQIRAMREQTERNWSQSELGARAGMRQNAISRLEKADYGNLNVNTLLRLASAFDVALLIKFVPFKKLLEEFSDLSTDAMEVPSFDAELPDLEDFATSVVTTVTTTTRTRTIADIPKITVRDFIDANLHWSGVPVSNVQIGEWLLSEASQTDIQQLAGEGLSDIPMLPTQLVKSAIPLATELVN